MAKIKQLSTHEAQKIAAGEVVERPANIVKELVENSIDAGATRISIYIKESGKKLIRVVDNGSGMDADDALLCFNRHATSKITCVEELESLTTFGFRGEALASIAAVSKIILITKEETAVVGTQICVNAHVVEKITSVACTTGTDISVQDLFFNVPARKKFLKTDQTEWRAIQFLFNALCFDYPHIHFFLFADDKQMLNCPATTTLKNRALQVWEAQHNHHLIELIEQKTDEYVINGLISNHQHYRYDRSGIYFFINQRWIKNQSLSSALLKGYAHVIPEGRYPAAIITITVPPSHVDINIHPRKEEVKFLYPKKIEQALQQAIKTTLERHLSAQIKKEVHFQPSSFQTPTTSYKQPATFTPFDFDAFFSPQKIVDPVHVEPQIQTPIQSSTPFFNDVKVIDQQEENSIQTIEIQEKSDYRLIGQYQKTYLLLEREDGLFLIDQHAAHERILYELFSTRFDDVATINLLFPTLITLTQQDVEVVVPHLSFLHANGIMAEQCARDQLIIQSLPVYLKDVCITELIKTMIGWIHDYHDLDAATFKKTINEKLHAQMACKAAVKAGDILTQEKMEQLLTDLHKTANRFSCPHGRPTGWLLSLHEIEKKFKRKL